MKAEARRSILFGANSSWNLVNFRKPLIHAVKEAGFRPIAAVPAGDQGEALATLGVQIHRLRMDARGVSPANDLRLLLGFIRLMRKTRPSAYLAFTAKPNIYGLLAARILGIPAIATITGLGTSFLSGSHLELLVSNLYRIALRRAACVFFHNEEDRALFIEHKIVRPSVAQVVPGSGVDLGWFTPGPARTPDQRLTFLFIGRLLYDKGALEFAQAASAIRASGAAFRMLGSIDDHPRGVPREAIQPFIDDGTIELLRPADDVRPFIADADCVVLPSYREGLPRALLEACAMAKPVIATDVPGCRQAVDDQITGILCEARSAHSLARAMMSLAHMSSEARNEMGLRGRRKAELAFSEGRVVSAYLSALAELGR